MRQSTIAFLIAIAACGGSDTSTAPTTVAGSWVLATYNGSALPVVASNDVGNSLKIEITSGNFNMSPSLTYTAVGGIRTTDHGVVTTSTDTCTGSYVVGGNNLGFTEVVSGQYCGGTFAATWDGNNALTFAFKNGDSAVYHR